MSNGRDGHAMERVSLYIHLPNTMDPVTVPYIIEGMRGRGYCAG